ncbi:MAG: tRNA1(Val) (adenine(37)-N6)-methyltransferase [Lachnospiraceae bacterium]|nr:tRNA1(Val) (adenine(37)-N6)-methyltransferase [Lachnospiraceae bacterium]
MIENSLLENNNTSCLNPGERLDDLMLKGYQIIQNPKSFCFGTDAVLLSDFAASCGLKGRILDLGTGTGIMPILLAGKTEAPSLVGLEIQTEAAEMAERSVKLNGLEDRVHIVRGDIRESGRLFSQDSFDSIVSNPPYIPVSGGFLNPGDSKAISRHELLCTLEDILKAASSVLKVKGTFFMVHRPGRLTDILIKMRQYHLEPKRLRMVYPTADSEPVLILIEGRKGGKAGLSTDAPLILRNPDGSPSKEYRRIYGFQGNP